MIKIFVYERTNVCSGKDRRSDQHTDILQGRHNRMRCRTDKVGFEEYTIIDKRQGTIFIMYYTVYFTVVTVATHGYLASIFINRK